MADISKVSIGRDTYVIKDSMARGDIANIKCALAGRVYNEREDANAKIVKTVPVGALPYASMDILGGMSRKGKNLISVPFVLGHISTDGSISHDADSNKAYYYTEGYIKCQPNKTYTLQCNGVTHLTLAEYKSDKTFVQRLAKHNYGEAIAPYIFATGENTEYLRVDVGNYGGRISAEYTHEFAQLEEGSTAHDYEPYTSTLIDAKVDKVVTSQADGTVIGETTLPTSVTSLDGYGIGINNTCYNYLEFTGDKVYFHKKVGKVDLTNATWGGRLSDTDYCVLTTPILDIKHDTPKTFNAISSKYNCSKSPFFTDKDNYDSFILADWYQGVLFKSSDVDETDTSLKAKMSGVILYYELATETVTDVSSYFSLDSEILSVEPNGSIQLRYPQLENGYDVDVPNTITYYEPIDLKTDIDELQNSVLLKADKTEVSELKTRLSDVESNTCVNLLNPTLTTTTINGIICTYHDGTDGYEKGTYTLNGTATDTTYLVVGTVELNVGTYHLVGCPSGGAWSKYCIYPNGISTGDKGEGNTFTIAEARTVGTNIKVESGVTCNNLVFKPMLTTNLNATYDDFVPYCGEGRLNEIVSDMQSHTIRYLTPTVSQNASSANGVYKPLAWSVNAGLTAVDGMIISIKMPSAGHDYGVFLSVDNGTNYYPIGLCPQNNNKLTTHFPNGATLILEYTSTQRIDSVFPMDGAGARVNITGGWKVVNSYLDGNTVAHIREENGRIKAGANGIQPYTIVALDTNGAWQSLVKAGNNGTGTSKTINDAEFVLNPTIRYYNANNSATSGNTVSNTYCTYSAYCALDTRYSHNHTTTFAVNTPIYIECTINGGTWTPTSTCLTQTFTKGRYYIYLGNSYSTEYQMSLATDHPVYYYNGTKLVAYEAATYSTSDVEASSTNGNIKINGTETKVYTHPSGTNPHGTTKSDVGLGNVGNFKAVSTVASQGLTEEEKANARANIGAGASGFSGSYNDLTDKPTIPTSLPANGGNADTVDNKHASDFLRDTTINLLKPTLQTTTTNGVTCTNNGDGTYTLNGTATDTTYLVVGTVELNVGTYHLVGCPSGGAWSKYCIYPNGISTGDKGEGNTFTIAEARTVGTNIKVESGVTCNNLVFKPMLTTNLLAAYDDFVPYTGDTGKLNTDFAEEKYYSEIELADLKMLGYTVPREMPVQNYVDSSGVYHQKVSRVDLGSLSWTYAFRDNTFYADISNSVNLVTYCSKYKNITTFGDDKSVLLSSNRIYIQDSAYGNDQAIAFKSAMSGVYLYYELATEKTYSVDGNEISNDVTDLKMLGYTIPRELSVRNYVDSNRIYHQRVGRVDLGSLVWNYGESASAPYGYFVSSGLSGENTEWYCNKYHAGTVKQDKSLYFNKPNFVIIDSDYTDADTFTSAVQGVYLYYSLKSEITQPVDGGEYSCGVAQKRENGCSYNHLASRYASSKTTYLRIALPFTINMWCMYTMELTVRRDYGSGEAGKIFIHGNWTTNGGLSQFWAQCTGTLKAGVKVYESDNRYIYIYLNTNYSTCTIDKMTVGDAAVGHDLSGITMDGVDTLPETYRSATMYYTPMSTGGIFTVEKSVPSDAKFTDTNTWRPLGTTADTACAGNDSRLSNARTPTAHNQAASTVTAGTFAGQVNANATAKATLTTAQVRDIQFSTTDLTAGSSALATGNIYIVYE